MILKLDGKLEVQLTQSRPLGMNASTGCSVGKYVQCLHFGVYKPERPVYS